MKFFYSKKQHGFTLVETMVSMTIFSVLVVYGLGSVLTAISQHERSQNMSNVMDNLNFILEDMSRNIRLGTNFHCFAPDESGTGVDGSGHVNVVPQDCQLGVGSNEIVFQSVSGVAITYLIAPVGGVGQVQIQKIVGNGTAQILTPTYVIIDSSKSGFIVYGAPQGDGLQPVINISLSGKVTYRGTDSSFSIQTTVASRPLDG
ncbi:MAG: type II secretion system protein [bacterium]